MTTTTSVAWKVLYIDFDFEMEDGTFIDKSYRKEVKDQVMNKVWIIDKDQELSDVISDETGWCINEIFMEEVK